MDKHKQAPAVEKQPSRYKFFWIFLAIVVLGFIAKTFLSSYSSNQTDLNSANLEAPRTTINLRDLEAKGTTESRAKAAAEAKLKKERDEARIEEQRKANLARNQAEESFNTAKEGAIKAERAAQVALAEASKIEALEAKRSMTAARTAKSEREAKAVVEAAKARAKAASIQAEVARKKAAKAREVIDRVWQETMGAFPPPAMMAQKPKSMQEVLIDKTMGNILYNRPEKMIRSKDEIIEVNIANGELTVDVMGNQSNVVTESFDAFTGPVDMSVKLHGSAEAFVISRIGLEKQAIDGKKPARWKFLVTPLKSGMQTLTLEVNSFFVANGKDRQGGVTMVDDEFEVEISPEQEIKNLLSYWKWLVLAALLALLAFYAIRYFKGRRPNNVSGNEAVFLSYRRDDSSGYTLAIYQKLKEALGDDKVFMDLDDIPHGVDFSEHLEKVLSNSTTVLIMIGEGWLNASNDEGRRLDDPDDFVRIEVATALNRDVRVIPVLLKQAQMPNEAELPDALKALSRRNAIRIHDDQFDASIQKLVKSIG